MTLIRLIFAAAGSIRSRLVASVACTSLAMGMLMVTVSTVAQKDVADSFPVNLFIGYIIFTVIVIGAQRYSMRLTILLSEAVLEQMRADFTRLILRPLRRRPARTRRSGPARREAAKCRVAVRPPT